jgi:hypothetical protein
VRSIGNTSLGAPNLHSRLRSSTLLAPFNMRFQSRQGKLASLFFIEWNSSSNARKSGLLESDDHQIIMPFRMR